MNQDEPVYIGGLVCSNSASNRRTRGRKANKTATTPALLHFCCWEACGEERSVVYPHTKQPPVMYGYL